MVKKNGIINEIIYNNTVYHNGEYHFYLTIDYLDNLINEIILSKSTPEKYLRFIPFYMNNKLNLQLELDEYMFYLECRNKIKEKEYENFIIECIDNEFEDVIDSELICAKMQYFLCIKGDYIDFNNSLKKYIEYIYRIIPVLYKILKKNYCIKEEDFLFGYISFEINCE